MKYFQVNLKSEDFENGRCHFHIAGVSKDRAVARAARHIPSKNRKGTTYKLKVMDLWWSISSVVEIKEGEYQGVA